MLLTKLEMVYSTNELLIRTFFRLKGTFIKNVAVRIFSNADIKFTNNSVYNNVKIIFGDVSVLFREKYSQVV